MASITHDPTSGSSSSCEPHGRARPARPRSRPGDPPRRRGATTGLARDITFDPVDVTVADTMTPGVVACPFDTPLRDVARQMAERRIHCVVVCEEDQPDRSTWGVVSDLDLVAAANGRDLDRWTAGRIAATPAVSVAADETLARAAQLMTEHAVAHLIVVDRASRLPVGVLSSLDLARAVAARRPADREPNRRRLTCASIT